MLGVYLGVLFFHQAASGSSSRSPLVARSRNLIEGIYAQ